MTQLRAQDDRRSASSADQAAVLLDRVVRKFVSDPDAVEVGVKAFGDRAQFTLRLAPDDFRSVALSQRTLSSLQCIVGALGRRSGLEFVLDCQTVDGSI